MDFQMEIQYYFCTFHKLSLWCFHSLHLLFKNSNLTSVIKIILLWQFIVMFQFQRTVIIPIWWTCKEFSICHFSFSYVKHHNMYCITNKCRDPYRIVRATPLPALPARVFVHHCLCLIQGFLDEDLRMFNNISGNSEFFNTGVCSDGSLLLLLLWLWLWCHQVSLICPD